jgi:hypothetical protein
LGYDLVAVEKGSVYKRRRGEGEMRWWRGRIPVSRRSIEFME